MKRTIGKRAAAFLLTAVFLGNAIQLPEGAVQVLAQGISTDEGMTGKGTKGSQESISGNAAVSDNAAVSGNAVEEEEADVLCGFLHIGQTTDMEEQPRFDTEGSGFDMPVYLGEDSQVRLFAGWKRADEDTPEYLCKGTLTWSILRGKKGTEPGTAALADGEDDWEGFETVSASDWFAFSEDGNEDSLFYKTLTIAAQDLEYLEEEEDYDYYVRAAFQYAQEPMESILITTVPILMTEDEVPEEPEAAGREDSETAGEEYLEAAGEKDSEITGEADSEAAGGTKKDLAEEPAGNAIGVSKLTLNKTNAVMNPGDTLKPVATVVPEGLNLDIQWTSRNQEVAVVDEFGTICAREEGSTEIIAECGGKTALITIEVMKSDAEKNGDKPADEEGGEIAISDEIWVAGFEKESPALTFTGNRITQELRIYHKGTLLSEKTDYTLTYKNNINAAAGNALKSPSVTITMKGQYTGSRTLYFTIAPREIDENQSLGYEQVVPYARKLSIPKPTLYFGSRKLTFNKDFTCDYSSLPQDYTKGDSYEEGAVYEYVVNGKGNFTGSFKMQMTVIKDKKRNFEKAVVSFDKKQYEYQGEALTGLDVGITSVKLNNMALEESLYEYRVRAEGTGNGYVDVYPSEAGRSEGYRGTKTLKIKVVGDRKMADCTLGSGWQESMTFSRQKMDEYGGICQDKKDILVYGEDSQPLAEGVDYTVKYSNHKKAGTATIIVTGMGRYTGSRKMRYNIRPNTELQLQWYDTDERGAPVAFYVKGGAIPRFSLMEADGSLEPCVLSNKTDYTVSLANNQTCGMMTCTITGKGNYKGYKSITQMAVMPGDIGLGTITVKDVPYSTKRDAWKSTVTIRDSNGKKMKAGTDYDRKLIYRYDGMETGIPPQTGTIVYVTAEGMNHYEGSSVTGSYRIYSTSISKLTVIIEEQEYTGKDIELLPEDIHVYASKSDRKNGKEIEPPCYEVTGYTNNRKAGTAKVTLRGIGEYGGIRECSFKITKKKYQTVRVAQIALDETSITLGIGNSRTLTAAVLPEDAWNKTVIWTTSNSKVATVNQEGTVTAQKTGTATIYAIAQDTGKKASCKVKAAVIPVTSFSLNAERICQPEGTRYQLKATQIQPEEASYSTIQWESTNPEAASVDDNGSVSLNKAGMAVIKAYADNRGFVKKCLVFVQTDEKEPEGFYYTPQMFRTSEEDDDTRAFAKAIEAVKNAGESCDTVYVPAGIYKINAEAGIWLESNMNFVMSPEAVLQAMNNSSKSYNVIVALGISNVTISGGRVIGERYGHGGSTGEWGMGIGIYDSADIRVTGVDISQCWGDGIYIGSKHEADLDAGCNRITITNCNVYNNRRNNLSIVSADNVEVDGCTFQGAGGTAPEFGIDIETNNTANPCEHIVISNSTFSGNGQASIGIITSADDITISGCTLNDPFINYVGTNVTISNSAINSEMYARVGVSLVDGTKINDGSSEEDLLVAAFHADKGSYKVTQYLVDEHNLMSCSLIEDSDSPSGKALCLRRLMNGTKEAGYYFDLKDLAIEGDASLEKGAVYRFEYVVKGNGYWGIRTDQTGWYPCAPTIDKFRTCATTYAAGSANSCRVILYALDKEKDIYLEIDSIKVYKVR